MKIKTISIGYKRKLNLGDFNSADVECTVWADIEEGESHKEALQQLTEIVRENVKERAVPLLGKGSMTNDNFKTMFAGLPVELQETARRAGYNGN